MACVFVICKALSLPPASPLCTSVLQADGFPFCPSLPSPGIAAGCSLGPGIRTHLKKAGPDLPSRLHLCLPSPVSPDSTPTPVSSESPLVLTLSTSPWMALAFSCLRATDHIVYRPETSSPFLLLAKSYSHFKAQRVPLLSWEACLGFPAPEGTAPSACSCCALFPTLCYTT